MLSEKETELYLASLKAGKATANTLSELTGIRRSTVYEVIESLKRKGIMASFKKDKKYYFSAAKPKALIYLLREKERNIKNILPELEKFSASTIIRQEAEFLEVISSIKQEVLNMLNHKEILVYGASAIGDEFFGSFTANFARKRIANRVKMCAIIGKTIPAHMRDSDVKSLTFIRTLDLFENHKTAYFIYGDVFLTISLGGELAAIKIKSKNITNSQRQIFEELWKIAEK